MGYFAFASAGCGRRMDRARRKKGDYSSSASFGGKRNKNEKSAFRIPYNMSPSSVVQEDFFSNFMERIGPLDTEWT